MFWTCWAYNVGFSFFFTSYFLSKYCIESISVWFCGKWVTLNTSGDEWVMVSVWLMNVCWLHTWQHWLSIDLIWGVLSLFVFWGAAWYGYYCVEGALSVTFLKPLVLHYSLYKFSYLCGIQIDIQRERRKTRVFIQYPKHIFIILMGSSCLNYYF